MCPGSRIRGIGGEAFLLLWNCPVQPLQEHTNATNVCKVELLLSHVPNLTLSVQISNYMNCSKFENYNLPIKL